MATLKAMFKLFDGYSKTINVINKKTDEATSKILKASGQTDKFNKKLKALGTSAVGASGGLTRLVGAVISLAAAKKAIEITDEFTNMAARLDLINDSLQTQAELQDKIFDAANKSRGAYSVMAQAVSKMGLLAREAFTSNDELIAFTELLQKSFKIAGAGATEQASAMLQLTQAMASGRLQGDEFRSIMENAPMLADAIAKYMGKSKGELKELSSEGLITSDIIKNALFMAAGDINDKFEKMPMTFADVWNKIKNGALKAFQPVMEKINEIINTPEFANFINNIIGGINLIATGISKVISFVQQNWQIIEPILYGIIGALALIAFVYLPAIIIESLAATWPFLLIGAAIGLLIYAMIKFGDTTAKIFGYIVGAIMVIGAVIYNMIVDVINGMVSMGDFIANLFVDIINGIIDGINFVINALNLIPGVEIGTVGKMEHVESHKLARMDLGDAWNIGQDIGQAIGGSLSGLDKKLSSFIPDLGASAPNIEDYMISGALPVTGVNGDKIEVDMSDEDLKYLRDIAERDYINKFTTATLAPNITVQFGDVHETADADKVAGRIRKILQEEIAMTAEGVYA